MKLDLGCGSHKNFDCIGIDAEKLSDVDIVADLEKGLPMFRTNTVEEVHCYHLLEHIQKVLFLIEEIHRVLKPNGKLFIRVPHFSSRIAHDIHHIRFFCLLSLDYLDCDTDIGKINRNNTSKKKICDMFKIVKKEIRLFKSFLLPHTYIFALVAKYCPNYYEQHLCYLAPASEICFELRKKEIIK